MNVTIRRLPLSNALIPVLLGAAWAGCGGSDGPTDPAAPTTLTLQSGGNQSGSVGVALTQPIVVVVSGRSGPVGGVMVNFQIQSGGGFLSRANVASDASGTATVVWTLGPLVGEQMLRASVSTLTPVTISAMAGPGAPALLDAVAGNGQLAVVSRPVVVPPRVRVTDAFGNPRAGIAVTFSVKTGGGAITAPTGTTNAAGEFTIGGWTLGPSAGLNELQVTADQLVTSVTAFGTAALLVAFEGNGQVVNAGTLVPIGPAVQALGAAGQPVENVVVSFSAPSGSGSVQGGTRTTDASGIARVGGWVLGVVPGLNTLAALATGVSTVTFTATGVDAVPAVVAPVGATAFNGFFGNFLAETPTIRVTDAAGSPVAGENVAFQALSGGGALARTSGVTDFEGRAVLSGWRLGPSEPQQAVEAVVAGLPPVQFTAQAEAPPPSEYDVELRYAAGTPTAAQEAAFSNAVARWEGVILGDLESGEANFPAGPCLPVAINETIDDVVIFVSLVAIDGVGGVLGSAGPCLVREENSLTAVGRMRFDTADLASLESQGQLESVIMHEMGHVLGFGTLWQDVDRIVNAGGSDPYFDGPSARAAFAIAAAPAVFGGNSVPVENSSGAGTRDVHWRESVFDNELMTGFLDPGVNPLSAVTTASMRDLGYTVNDAVSDPYTLPAFLRALAGDKLHLVEAPIPGPIFAITPSGRVTRTIFR